MAKNAARIEDMSTYTTDSTGARVAWARKQKRMSGQDLAKALGIGNVHVSNIENDRRSASRQTLQRIAALLDVTVGFLLMETDDPAPAATAKEVEPVYWSAEADSAARLVDAAQPEERARMLAVLRAMAEYAQVANSEPNERSHLISRGASVTESLQGRLILGEYFGRHEQRTGA